MRPLSFLEQEIEELGRTYDVDEQYDEDAVLRIYEMLERTRLQGTRAIVRKSVTTSTSWTTGMYTHGGWLGIALYYDKVACNYLLPGEGGEGAHQEMTSLPLLR